MIKRKNFSSTEEKIEALAKFLDIAPDDVSEESVDTFEANGKEWRVLTDQEADEAVEEETRNIMDEMGLEAFNPDFQETILRDYVNDHGWFQDALQEDMEYYAADLEDDRLIEECQEADLIKNEDFETDEDGEPDYDQCKLDRTELEEKLVEHLVDEAGDPMEWFKDNFGEEEFKDAVIEHCDFDYEGIAQEAISWDGRGHFLNTYDGREEEVEVNNETYYIYRLN